MSNNKIFGSIAMESFFIACSHDTGSQKNTSPEKLADYNHPLVIETAEKLTKGESSNRSKMEKLFYYVRDDIRFGFTKNGDLVKASETIRLKMGQCNTKGTLFLALCKASEIPSRIHFSTIKKEIQRGLFTGLAYKRMPNKLSHSWIEVEVEGKWRRIDSYINDQAYYQAAKSELKKKKWDTGYSVSCPGGECSCEFNIDQEVFVQMEAVVDDHGTWDDPLEYYETKKYLNRLGAVKSFFYRLIIKGINKKAEQMRKNYAGK